MSCFSSSTFSPIQRKTALLEAIKHLEATQNVRCLSFTAEQRAPENFPAAWKRFDFGLVLSKE